MATAVLPHGVYVAATGYSLVVGYFHSRKLDPLDEQLAVFKSRGVAC
jgi:hypothetical protein